MSSILSSQGVVLATAMAAVSGTVILLAFRHQKFTQAPRPCLSSDRKRRRKKNKRVHFAEDVVEPSGDGVEFRKRHRKVAAPQPLSNLNNSNNDCVSDGDRVRKREGKVSGMPENRVALYSGMLRGRGGHRLGYSYYSSFVYR